MSTKAQEKDKKHVRISKDAHRSAKVAAAKAGLTLEAWLESMIQKQLEEENKK